MPLPFTKSYGTNIDWSYRTIPQRNLGGKIITWPRGKVLGGTSLLNASIYTRCSPEDFDQWVKAGATGWSYSDLEKYFRKAESFDSQRKILSKIDLEKKGRDGKVEIGHTTTEDIAPILHKIEEACKTLGLPYLEDNNGEDALLGFTHLVGMVDSKGERVSSAKAYLTPTVLSRRNLTVATNMMVEKVLFSDSGPIRAVGVQVSASKCTPSYRIAAEKEVILSAGAFGSPQLLLLSGVGPKEELASINIKCVQDTPHVGKHLLDVCRGSLSPPPSPES